MLCVAGKANSRDCAAIDLHVKLSPHVLQSLKASLLATTAICVVMVLSHPASAQSPTGGSVVAGTAGISQAGAVTNINQSSQKAIINWQGFSVGAQNTVNFNQPNSSAATLNRVIGNEQSIIDGAINANGQVFIVNSAGVLFGKGSQVNVGGIVASTLDISNSDFMAGNYKFSGTSNASVVNQGRIRARGGGEGGGYVALLGKTVSNEGMIAARLGTVAMAAGEKITLNFGGDSLVDVTIDKGTLNALVQNKRAIIANGGQVIMTARAADQVLSAQVNNSGVIQARTMAALKGGSNGGTVRIGKIKLLAQGGTTNVSGKLDVSAPKGGHGGSISVASTGGATTVSGKLTAAAEKGVGGTVVVTGPTVGLTTTAAIDASGTTGGTILVGGDRLGGSDASQKFLSAPVANAMVTTIAQGATLTANGSNGNGGNIVVWSDGQTNYAGSISGTAAGSSGNGGFAEVSSHGLLNFIGSVNLSSTHGAAGTLLLDPYNVVISSGADANGGFDSGSPNTYTPTGTSVINTTTLLNALANADVVITTGNTGTAAGNINVDSDLNWSSSTHSLTLSAAGGIIVRAAMTWSGSSALTMIANTITTSNNALTGTIGTLTHTGNGGSLTLTANSAITIGREVTLGNASFTATSAIGNIAISRTLTWEGSAVSLQTGATGNISTAGAGALTQIGNGGSLSLTNLGTGNITLAGAVSLGTASLTAKVNGPAASIAINNTLSWSGSAVKLTASGGSISTRALTQTGNGSLVLETIGNGAITLSASNTLSALGNGSLTASAAAGAIAINGPMTWSGSQVKFTTTGGSITAGALTQTTGNGSLVLDAAGAGTINLNGEIVLNNGSLTASTTTGAIAINNKITWSGTQVKFTTTGGSITAGALTQTTGNGNLTLDAGTGNLTLNGAVSLDNATSNLTGMDVIVNAPISWASGQTLTLTADRNITINTSLAWSGGTLVLGAANNIYVNGDLTGTGSNVALNATFGTGVNPDGTPMGLQMGLTVGGYHKITLPGTAAVSLNGATYSIITNKAQFEAIGSNLSGRYVLVSDIADVSFSDFQRFGLGTTNQFSGSFHGFGHSLTMVPGSVPISSSLALTGLTGAAIVLPFIETINIGGSIAFSSAGGIVAVTTTGDINVTAPLTVSAPAFSLSAGGNLNVTASSFNLSNGTILGLAAAKDVNINNALSWSSGTLALTAGQDININNAVTVGGATAKLTMTYGGNYNIRTLASYSGVAPLQDPVVKPVLGLVDSPDGTKAGLVIGQVYDRDGKPVYEVVRGDLIYDREGNPVYQTYLDPSGNPVQGSQVTGPVVKINTSGGVYGSINFTNSSNKNGLVINGATYTLVHSMSELANITSGTPDINGYANGNGSYALAGNLYATSNGTSSGTPTSYSNAVVASLGGTLAGLGHTISKLTINAGGTDNIGLIGQITAPNTAIRDIGLIETSITGRNQVGALLGNYTSTGLIISQAYSTGAIVGTNFVGGLVGNAGLEPADAVNVKSTVLSTIHDSFSTASVSGIQRVGGLIGNASGATIFDTHATGNVTGNIWVGGLIGRMTFTTVDTSYATGDVKGVITGGNVVSNNIGGLIGYIQQWPQPGAKSSVSNSFATGAVSGEHTLGGLIGRASGLTSSGDVMAGYDQFWTTVTNTYATGNVTLNDASNLLGSDYNQGVGSTGFLNAGGLIGSAANVIIANSFATGDVVSNARTSGAAGGVGGLVGRMFSRPQNGPSSDGSIANSFATGDVRAAIRTDGNATYYIGNDVGGLVGSGGTTTITSSYATGNVAGGDRVGGLVGGGSSQITDSFATGNATGTSGIGGLVGVSGANITGSFAYGNVAGISFINSNGVPVQSRQVGGLVGTLDGGQITNSGTNGATSGSINVGGLVGQTLGQTNITNSFWNGNSSPNPVSSPSSQTVITGGGALTPGQLADIRFYANGTINQVLAGRATAAAAAQAAAALRAAAVQGASVANSVSNNAVTSSQTPPDRSMSAAGKSAAKSTKSAAVEESVKSVDDAAKADDKRQEQERAREQARRRAAAQASHRGQGGGGGGGGLGATIRSIDVNGQRFNLDGGGAPKPGAPAQPPQ
jgi:filamentous hemagglutinin family protein